MKEIKIIRNNGVEYIVILDDEDYEILKNYKWRICPGRNTFYAQRRGKINDKFTIIKMHREIMHPSADTQIDHKNGNGLDNRKENLRFCSGSENQQNRRKRSDYCTSQYKGVSFNKERKKWVAEIRINSKLKFLGRFKIEIEAARAYNKAAKEFFGEFAKINII